MSRDQRFIKDIVNAAREILDFTVDMDYVSLESDRRSISQTYPCLRTFILTITKVARTMTQFFCTEQYY